MLSEKPMKDKTLKKLRVSDKMDKIILKNAKKILPVPHSLDFFLLCAYVPLSLCA